MAYIFTFIIAFILGHALGRHYGIISRAHFHAKTPDIVNDLHSTLNPPTTRIISPLKRKRNAQLEEDLNS